MAKTPSGAAAIRTEKDSGMVRVKWDFDGGDRIYDGYSDFSTWNGFDNIWVTRDVFKKIYAAAKKDRQLFNPDDWPDAPDEYGFYSLANGFSTSIRGFETWETFVTNPFTDDSGRFLVNPHKYYKKTSRELAKIFGKNWREMKKWV